MLRVLGGLHAFACFAMIWRDPQAPWRYSRSSVFHAFPRALAILRFSRALLVIWQLCDIPRAPRDPHAPWRSSALQGFSCATTTPRDPDAQWFRSLPPSYKRLL